MRDGGKSWREKGGLKAPSGPREQAVYLSETRQLALESLVWHAAKRKDGGQILALHAYAAGLPLKWWIRAAQLSINELLRAIEREMENPCPSA